jgi:LCP family protein required for cell wall assembly
MTLIESNPVVSRARFRVPRGCLWALFAAVMIPVFLCGLSLIAYLVFPPAPLNILVVGVDGRGNEGFLSRTDSIMILGVDSRRLRVNVLSIPRDLFINTPGYGLQRINTINMLGEEKQKGDGPELLSAAIQQSFGIHIDRYVRLNFQSFIDLINAVGGVTIDVDRAIVDDAYPTDDYGTIRVRFDSGVQQMDGERALIYARTRHADDDYHRASRQQQVLAALMARLANPARWPAALRVLNGSVDTNLNIWDFVSSAPPVILNLGRFDQLVIDPKYSVGTKEGHALPNYKLLDQWLQGRFK